MTAPSTSWAGDRPIALASDHAGFALKQSLKEYLTDLGYEVADLGPYAAESVDYPDFGYAAAEEIAKEASKAAIVVCGSGIGISIAANRNPAARAALCQNGLMAKLSRQHNDANILALGERLIGIETAKDCVNAFLNTEFEGGRHQRRVDLLNKS